ncbi:ubiquitin-specific protease [Suhomyces tanzawaensis NRRL Y-17324]|uniref:ubiquitinyl hydrolase 1 n=1 Tax=Suhomyces tanzawaensis NRRL Y-17324 TaxID=984487 RepID=A0A1E4SM96_9ASCO|nr:ubiquitin-specific protease [Suhomyces tanzawaensis NRRL Y-17324]ODV80649.1 ubiquitin-specific protease [Suhomyces tanzawaensis NRRL Y-17324]
MPPSAPPVTAPSNPLIDRYLTNPLTFKPGKAVSDPSSDRPASYIVLSRLKNPVAPAPKVLPEPEEAPMKPKPRSMAEAVAAYTGKKFLTKSEKRLLNKHKKQAKQAEDADDEDVGEAFLSEGDSHYESASEYLEGTDSPFTGFSEASGDTSEGEKTPATEDEKTPATEEEKNPVTEDENTSAPAKNEKGPAEETPDDDSDDNDFERSASSSSELSDAPVDEDADMEQLKHDLKADAAQTLPQEESKSTPPTSPEEEADAKPPVSLDGFYDFNENYNDRGANGSSRIHKSWRQLATSRPVGLLNHGVTCYMNSAIQSLVHIPAMVHYLNEVSAGSFDSSIKPRSVTHVMAELAAKMWGMDGAKAKGKPAKYINPKKIILRLDDINCMMSEWQQEDSHEYYMSLMSRLQEDSTPKGKKLNQSVIYDIFGGLLDQHITCSVCHNVSETKQEFYDLSLGLNKKKHKTLDEGAQTSHKYSIEKSMRDFFSNELIKVDKSDNSGYFCDKCDKRTCANKISFINRSPETLTIHLKRFKFNGNSSSKMKQAISYSKYLDLSEYTADKTPTKYKLISVIVHEGRSISSGHYVAHCVQPDGSWATYDDEYINKIHERQALSDPAAYVLVYTKLTPKAKRGLDGDEGARKKRKV